MEKNIALPEDLLTAVAEIARADGKTPEEVIEDATRRMLRIRGLRSLVAENRRSAQTQGLTEADVPRLIDEYRGESRGR
jgi:Arc/MetJ family transcription regulator